MPHLAEAVLQLLVEIGSVGALVVGHSMGGAVGLELSRRAPRVVGQLAMLDTVLWPGSELAEAVAGISRMLHEGKFDEALNAAKAALFCPYDSAAAVQLFERSFKAADPQTLMASFDAHLIEYDPDLAAAALSCPVAYIGTDVTLASYDALTFKIGGIRIGKVIGSGHFAPMLVPQQVNALLAGFLSLAGRTID